MTHDFSMAEITRATGGPIPWSDPHRQPIITAALWRYTQIKLAEHFGHDRTLNASLIGGYSDPQTRANMDAGRRAHSRWVIAQRNAGRSDTDRALRRAAKGEARTGNAAH
jgi:hypothetical protein